MSIFVICTRKLFYYTYKNINMILKSIELQNLLYKILIVLQPVII